ncbi:hypothetical protein LTR10_004784 [Elasticomyces elasticus]|nr:hypothetical protein LTR10_004784 [Elasticomyces elasticus]KAK4977101.1 hypothetical protein LTR42_003147 [Elasticomyces elasticus]
MTTFRYQSTPELASDAQGPSNLGLPPQARSGRSDSRVVSWLWHKLDLRKKPNNSDGVELISLPSRTTSTFRTRREKNPTWQHEYEEVPEASNSRADSWRPFMLQWTSLLALACVCVTLLVLLQVLDVVVRQHQGINASKPAAINCLRYIPTVAMVLLGFVWRSMVSDLKVLMPWAAMTDKPALAQDSLAVNYVNAIEVFAIFSAARKKHWPLCIALIGGLLSAVLVSFTNALAYVDVAANVVEHGVKLRQRSGFDFTDRFVHSNGSLTIAWNYTGSEPYAALMSAQQQNGNYPAWTADGIAFTSFDLVDLASPLSEFVNSTITANATAFTAALDCTPIRMSVVRPPRCTKEQRDNKESAWWRTLVPNEDDLAGSGCRNPSPIHLESLPASAMPSHGYCGIETVASGNPFDETGWTLLAAGGQVSPAAWLNLTECGSANDRHTRIWAHLLRPSRGELNSSFYETQSLLCEPSFYTQQMSLTVNSTTGQVLSYAPLTVPSAIEVTIAPDAIVTYMNNPLDGNSIDAFEYVAHGSVGSSQRIEPTINYANVANWAGYYYRVNDQDPFFSQELSGDRALLSTAFFNNATECATRLSSLFGNYMAQLANSMARVSTLQNMEGNSVVVRPQVFIRQWALRAAQATLAVLAVICFLLMSLLRLPSLLDEDCGTLAATAVILANSPQMEQLMLEKAMVTGTAHLSAETMMRLERNVDGMVCMHITEQHAEGSSPVLVLGHSRFRPTALHWLYVLAGLVLLAAMAATLREGRSGIKVSTDGNAWFAQDAWAFLPTIILLLLGYTLAGLSDSIHLLEPYRSAINQQGGTGQRTLLFNPINHSVFSLPYRVLAGAGSLVVLWTSVIILIFPGVKIAAAGLYTASSGDHFSPAQAVVDSSLPDQFEATYALSTAAVAGLTNRASQWTEWSQIEAFNLPPRLNTIDNLVFATLDTNLIGVEAVEAVVSAIEVEVSCETHDTSEFEAYVTAEQKSPYGYTVYWMFRPKTFSNVNSTGVSMVDYYEMTTLQNNISRPRFIGASFLPTLEDSSVIPGSPYTILLADYSSVQASVRNMTSVPELDSYTGDQNIQNMSVLAKPGMFNTTLPTVRAVVCTRNFDRVSVSASFAQSIQAGLNGSTKLLPWSVSSYSHESSHTAEHTDGYTFPPKAYNRTTPGWMYPYYPADDDTASGSSNVRTIANGATTGGNAVETIGDTVWPSKATSRNIWQQIAAYQLSQVRESIMSDSLLDVDNLAQAAEAVLTTYSIQMLSELRTYTSQLSASHTKRASNTVSVTARRRVPAITQSRAITYAIAAMLATVIICSILAASVYFPRPGRKGRNLHLRVPPGSIAAALELLAGSKLIAELRLKGARRTTDTRIWEGRFRLGWWQDGVPESQSDHIVGENGTTNRRWGIDIIA